MAKAMFGAGCFWGVEHAFRQIEGVTDVACGYAGGPRDGPTYEEVCTGRTGHAEVVEVDFDESRVTFDELLVSFWAMHDPTTLNRQGPDVGSQYRSVIFTHGPEQQAAALASKKLAQAAFDRPIVTQIEPAGPFFRAEEYHQQYFARRGMDPTCHL